MTKGGQYERISDVNVEDTDWADYLIEELVEDCKKLGVNFDSDEVSWSICSRDNCCYVRSCDLDFNWCNEVEIKFWEGRCRNSEFFSISRERGKDVIKYLEDLKKCDAMWKEV
ncbi:unnamed protein product, partial [marine sediment metagenome]